MNLSILFIVISTKHFAAKIKHLTSKGNNRNQNRINRLCVQFSICPNPNRQKKISDKVDVEFIAKKFVKNKSR